MTIFPLIFLTLLISFGANAQLPTAPDVPKKDFVLPKAVKLGRPPYPSAAKQVGASGQVDVSLDVDEQGNVTAARAVSGHPLLRQAAEQAAMESTFTPAMQRGKPVKYTGIIIFNFIKTADWESVGGTLAALVNGRAAINAGGEKSSDDSIWQGLETEQAEIVALQADESIDGKSERAQRLINVIRYKLRVKTELVELWYFDLGIIVFGIQRNAGRSDNEKDFYKYVDEFATLIKAAPKDVLPQRLKSLQLIAEKAEKKNLTRDQRLEIVAQLITSHNEMFNRSSQ